MAGVCELPLDIVDLARRFLDVALQLSDAVRVTNVARCARVCLARVSCHYKKAVSLSENIINECQPIAGSNESRVESIERAA